MFNIIYHYFNIYYYAILDFKSCQENPCRDFKQVSTLPESFPLPASLDSIHLSLCWCCTGHERASIALHAQRVACAICRVHITHTQRGRHKARSGLAGAASGMQIAFPTLCLPLLHECVYLCESFLLFLLWLCNCMANKLPHQRQSWHV